MILSTLLEITIYSAALFGTIWLFRVLMKKHLSPVMLYMAWFLVMARLLMPATFVSGFSFFTVPVAADTTAQASSVDIPALLDGLDNNVVQEQGAQANANGISQQSETSGPQTAQNAATETSSASASTVQMNITWETALIAIWLFGAAVMLAGVGVSTMRLRKRLKSAQTIPLEWQRMAEEMKTQLGIKRNIRIVMAEAFPSPALTSGIRPTIVLPEELLDKNDESVRFALLHELTHIKRKDNIISLLLLLLRCVYWFNPVVWLMLRQMRLDMETACDNSLTRPMSITDRKRYASTMLSMFARKQVRYVLGMSLGQTKKTAEQRLRGMFMRGRSSRRGKLISALLAALLLVTCFTTACQPTPKEEIVVGKDQDEMLEAAAQTPETEQSLTIGEQVDAPETYTADISAGDGKLTIAANGATFILPNADSMPIVRVSAADFSQGQVDRLISELFGEKTLFEVEYGAETKDEIMQQILTYKRLKETEEYSSEGDQQQLAEHIAMLQAKHENAPETSEDIIIESDGQLKQKELTDYETGEHISYYMGLNATTNTDDPTKAERISVQNNDDMTESIVDFRTDEDGNIRGMSGRFVKRMAMLSYVNKGDAYDSNFGQNPPIPVYEDTVIDDPEVLAKLTTTPAEAKALVEEMLARVGIDNMAVAVMYLTDDENLGNYDGIVSNAEHYAYKMYLCRTVGGVPVAYLNASSLIEDMEENFSEANSEDIEAMTQAYSNIVEWHYETIDVMVDDTGIISFDWRSPLNIGETVVESAVLMPFDNIAAKFEQQMQIEHEVQANEQYIADMSFTVDHVTLELQRIAEQDAIENGLLVPVWNFYGTSVITYNSDDTGDGSEVASVHEDGFSEPVSLMTINAIDGSIINTRKGY